MAKNDWDVEVYLEPGEAWALNAGFFLTSVLDILKNGETQIAIVDASAACHMPDVLEMPILSKEFSRVVSATNLSAFLQRSNPIVLESTSVFLSLFMALT